MYLFCNLHTRRWVALRFWEVVGRAIIELLKKEPLFVRGLSDSCTPRCYQQFFWYRYFAGIRFTWRLVFPVGVTNLAGNPFFRKRGAGCIKKGAGAPFFLKKRASAPFLKEKGVPAKKMIPKCTDRDFLRYRYGKYPEIPTDTNRKILIRYTTLVFFCPFECFESLGLPPVFFFGGIFWAGPPNLSPNKWLSGRRPCFQGLIPA